MINLRDIKEKLTIGKARIVESTEDNIVIAFKQYNFEKASIGELVELPERIETQQK